MLSHIRVVRPRYKFRDAEDSIRPLGIRVSYLPLREWQIRHSNTKGTSRSIAHIMGDIWAESLACHSGKISRWRKIYCAGACPVCITSGDLSAGSPDSRAAKLTNSRIGRSKPWRPGGVVQRRKLWSLVAVVCYLVTKQNVLRDGILATRDVETMLDQH